MKQQKNFNMMHSAPLDDLFVIKIPLKKVKERRFVVCAKYGSKHSVHIEDTDGLMSCK